MASTYESISAEYEAFGATEDDLMDANDNALQLLQDEHGYETVTAESMDVGGCFRDQFLELFASSLEGVRSEDGFGAR